MSFRELQSKEEFDSAIKEGPRVVFVFVYENEIPASAKEHLPAYLQSFPHIAPPVAFDIAKAPEARNSLKINKTPTILIYRGGQMLVAVEEPNKDKLEEVEGLFNS
ncbi:hypothetical protein DM02DRAFT_323779 [Periconia macrospinosa]|uniref:Thioredoxin domain-containing protein n=1 Tax=Periconia macrospinosa TaxID=97972 RepID=A0A2V1EDD2_9PLEO|nr:hypothetical protein DM02DRAFT_323779 [Periconia macrospinosa]